MKNKILVIDDDKGSANFLSIILQREGFEVAPATDGQAALDIVEQVSPDLIILDMYLPVMSGWDFLERYWERATSPAPIIALSAGNVDVETLGGVARFVKKPFSIAELLSTIHDVLH